MRRRVGKREQRAFGSIRIGFLRLKDTLGRRERVLGTAFWILGMFGMASGSGLFPGLLVSTSLSIALQHHMHAVLHKETSEIVPQIIIPSLFT
jgi:predicted small integral membrane protein